MDKTLREQMLKDLGWTLLVDSVCSEIESERREPLLVDEQELADRMYEEVIRPREDLCETLREFCEKYKIDANEHIPTDLIEQIECDVNKLWADKLTLAELFEINPRAAHRLALNAVGHGVAADDDADGAAIFAERGIPSDHAGPSGNFEGPFDKAADLIDEAVEKMSAVAK